MFEKEKEPPPPLNKLFLELPYNFCSCEENVKKLPEILLLSIWNSTWMKFWQCVGGKRKFPEVWQKSMRKEKTLNSWKIPLWSLAQDFTNEYNMFR